MVHKENLHEDINAIFAKDEEELISLLAELDLWHELDNIDEETWLDEQDLLNNILHYEYETNEYFDEFEEFTYNPEELNNMMEMFILSQGEEIQAMKLKLNKAENKN